MGQLVVDEDRFAGMLAEVRPHLSELQWRLLLGAQAQSLGRGGVKRVAALAGVHPDTVGRGAQELEAGVEPDGRVRRAGAGRPRAGTADAGLVPALRRLVDPQTRGDPESPLRWTTKSTEKLAGELTSAGHPVSADTVGRLLKEDGYSLQGNAKTVEGKQHPDRDGQFRLINELVREFQAAGEPVVSVDTKKKELVGNYKNGGTEWRPRGDPERVEVHDFKGELGRAVPYGVYDMTANAGWVNAGTDAGTGAFAVESIRRWWQKIGQAAYPHATRLLITADAGGSNGSRLRLWKVELARFAEELGLEISVSHFPPGTSKWNRIEHRLFAQISMNWRGRPLTSHEVIVETIAATTTTAGLTVQAALDTGTYQKGIKISGKGDAGPGTTLDQAPRFPWRVELCPPPRPAADTPDIMEINLRRALSGYAGVTRLADVFRRGREAVGQDDDYRRGAAGCLLAQRHRGEASLRTRGLQAGHRGAYQPMDFRLYWARPAVVTLQSWPCLARAVSGQAQAAEFNQEESMSGRESDALREHVDALQKQVTHLKEAAEQARKENSEQVKARIQQAKADMAAHHESAGEKAGQAAEGAQSQWQSMRADAQAKMRGLQDRVGRKRDELDVKTAEHDAEDAEANAVDALDFAWWAAEEAEVAVLDAIDARAWADGRAAASRTS